MLLIQELFTLIFIGFNSYLEAKTALLCFKPLRPIRSDLKKRHTTRFSNRFYLCFMLQGQSIHGRAALDLGAPIKPRQLQAFDDHQVNNRQRHDGGDGAADLPDTRQLEVLGGDGLMAFEQQALAQLDGHQHQRPDEA